MGYIVETKFLLKQNLMIYYQNETKEIIFFLFLYRASEIFWNFKTGSA